jgi:hypothetical protein
VGAGDIGGGTGAKSIHTLTEGAEHRTEDAFLEPPTNLEAEPSSPTSVRLKWQAPSIAVDSVSYYTVRYHPVQSALSVNASTLSYVRRLVLLQFYTINLARLLNIQFIIICIKNDPPRIDLMSTQCLHYLKLMYHIEKKNVLVIYII